MQMWETCLCFLVKIETGNLPRSLEKNSNFCFELNISYNEARPSAKHIGLKKMNLHKIPIYRKLN